MPLLPAEFQAYPENLFDCADGPEIPDQRWWVAHTRPRAEKSLARRLLKSRISYFLPQFRRKWRQRGRLLSSFLPLFPGYVFLFGDHQARFDTLATNLVAGVLGVEDQSQLWRDLRQVHRLIQAGKSLVPEDRLQPGSMVEVAYGPFAGMEGKVIFRNKMRFVVEVRFLQQGVSVEMEGWMLRRGDALASSCLIA